MEKSKKIAIIVIAIIAIVAVVVAIVMNLNKDSKKEENTSKLGEINSAEDLEKIIDKVYEGKEDDLPMLETQTIDVTDERLVQTYTGITNGQDLEYLVVSEPLMNAQAYSFVLAKVKNGVDANKIAKDMSDNIDTRKWICVSAEKLYATNSGNIVCLVMADEDWAKPVYDSFKELAGTVGEEYEKTEEIDLPPEMY